MIFASPKRIPRHSQGAGPVSSLPVGGAGEINFGAAVDGGWDCG
jgi:hypothetical protein